MQLVVLLVRHSSLFNETIVFVMRYLTTNDAEREIDDTQWLVSLFFLRSIGTLCKTQTDQSQSSYFVFETVC